MYSIVASISASRKRYVPVKEMRVLNKGQNSKGNQQNERCSRMNTCTCSSGGSYHIHIPASMISRSLKA